LVALHFATEHPATIEDGVVWSESPGPLPARVVPAELKWKRGMLDQANINGALFQGSTPQPLAERYLPKT
jgi:hypothetical protein